jgi:hypothetical protein
MRSTMPWLNSSPAVAGGFDSAQFIPTGRKFSAAFDAAQAANKTQKTTIKRISNSPMHTYQWLA